MGQAEELDYLKNRGMMSESQYNEVMNKLNPQALSPSSKSVGGRTGIAAYNGITIPDYQNPYDVEGFKGSKYYGIATGESMSPWSRLASEQQNRLAAQNNSKAVQKAQGNAGTVATRLAQQGGLTSGARERAQVQAGQNVLSMTQGNNETAANNVADIGIADAKQRMGMLADATGKLTSMTSGNVSGMNQYNQNTTNMLNQAVSANQTAEAQKYAAVEANKGSVILLVSTSLLGSLSVSEAKAYGLLSQGSKYTKLREARKTFGSEESMRGYCKFSNAISPEIENCQLAKKVLLHTMVKPIAKKGLVAKIWARVFGLLGKVA